MFLDDLEGALIDSEKAVSLNPGYIKVRKKIAKKKKIFKKKNILSPLKMT
jgi:hypothetical protein